MKIAFTVAMAAIVMTLHRENAGNNKIKSFNENIKIKSNKRQIKIVG